MSVAGNILNFLAEAWHVILGVLRFDPEAYRFVLTAPDGFQLALFILIISSLSYTIGQIVVLFANRVNRKHFLTGLAGVAFTLMISTFFWSASIWLAVRVLPKYQWPLIQTFSVVAISFAPLLFGFLILTPYLGNIIFYVLRIWVFLAVIVGTAVSLQTGIWEAILVSALGWIILEFLARIPFLQTKHLSDWLWRVSTGTDKQMDTGDLVAQFVDDALLADNHQTQP